MPRLSYKGLTSVEHFHIYRRGDADVALWSSRRWWWTKSGRVSGRPVTVRKIATPERIASLDHFDTFSANRVTGLSSENALYTTCMYICMCIYGGNNSVYVLRGWLNLDYIPRHICNVCVCVRLYGWERIRRTLVIWEVEWMNLFSVLSPITPKTGISRSWMIRSDNLDKNRNLRPIIYAEGFSCWLTVALYVLYICLWWNEVNVESIENINRYVLDGKIYFNHLQNIYP